MRAGGAASGVLSLPSTGSKVSSRLGVSNAVCLSLGLLHVSSGWFAVVPKLVDLSVGVRMRGCW